MDSFIGVALSVGILILLAVVAVNMLLLLVSGWLLMYAGIFFLGFGGSRWTSDMAINYYKTVLGVAVQIMTMVLLVGIGNDLLSSFYARMNTGTLNFEELGVMLVSAWRCSCWSIVFPLWSPASLPARVLVARVASATSAQALPSVQLWVRRAWPPVRQAWPVRP